MTIEFRGLAMLDNGFGRQCVSNEGITQGRKHRLCKVDWRRDMEVRDSRQEALVIVLIREGGVPASAVVLGAERGSG